ncbi:response regulator [Alterisphingorhabdus coralli]|uniref:Response regulator n=1 Tax=Alterisphingorhabdus coralli TaxID=3071408 RepID=A0AA97I0S1_9SPHN|nr:response regulator [Parasphingorhabdus sp. SCSIO 66989]WOE75979.1 response regulator [Parasphingorhabdus sp. SCSIO 66989]
MSLGQELAPHLPFLRRYARALAGEQQAGDAYVKSTLETIVEAPQQFPRDMGVKLGLYRTFQAIWASTSEDGAQDNKEPSSDLREHVTRKRLVAIPSEARQALLLTAMEGFSHADTALLMERDETEISGLVDEALAEIDKQISTRVLIIEDEPIIAMDIETIVEDMGHDVTGIAVTRDEAVALAEKDEPGLILADIQLADNSSGIDAVADILGSTNVPVVFITAFPERLLTGEKLEPAFLITKPFQRDTVRAAISQALFFHQV